MINMYGSKSSAALLMTYLDWYSETFLFSIVSKGASWASVVGYKPWVQHCCYLINFSLFASLPFISYHTHVQWKLKLKSIISFWIYSVIFINNLQCTHNIVCSGVQVLNCSKQHWKQDLHLTYLIYYIYLEVIGAETVQTCRLG